MKDFGFTTERIKSLHWTYDHLEWFNPTQWDDFLCVVDQREAYLLGLVTK